MLNSIQSKAFAPVNIAWIKYMGKNGAGAANSSLSLTLNSFGTTTSMQVGSANPYLSFVWDAAGYVPPESGRKKAETFLKKESMWNDALAEFGFEALWPTNKINITTANNVPAGTGIATSASAFAALTLAWSSILAGTRLAEWIQLFNSGDSVLIAKLRKTLGAIAAQGSGSACRSLDGPWVEWSPADGISKIDGGPTQWVDLILLIETAPKSVSSSEAHARVKTSPLYVGRAERAEKRLAELKNLLKQTPASIPQIQKLVLDEALDMHELFHTSVPAFDYMQSDSKKIVFIFRERSAELPTPHGVITLDAGANVHLFVPMEEQQQWSEWLSKKFPSLKVLVDIGKNGVSAAGARYEIL